MYFIDRHTAGEVNYDNKSSVSQKKIQAQQNDQVIFSLTNRIVVHNITICSCNIITQLQHCFELAKSFITAGQQYTVDTKH